MPNAMRILAPAALLISLAAAPPSLTAQADAVVLATAPTALAFTYQTGNPLPGEQKVSVKRFGSGPAVPFTATVTGAPWLILSASSGKTPGSVGVRVNPTSLLAGTYKAVIEFTAPGAANPAAVNVTLTVRYPPPTPTVTPSSLSFTFQTDAGPLEDQTVMVSSSGEPISFTAAVSGSSWLSVEPSIGIAVTGSPAAMAVKVNTDGLVPGTYTGRISLTFTNASVRTAMVPVTLTVTAGVAVIDSIWPSAAPIGSDDTVVTIRGRHFFQSSAVQAGSTALSTTWVGTTVMLAVVPKDLLVDPGTLAITVINAPQPASAPVDFTVTPPGPVIQAVVNAASFHNDNPTPVLSPGEIISIFGSGLGPGVLLEAVPTGGVFPTSLGDPATTVEFELTPGTWTAAPIIFAHANQVNAVAPFAMTPGEVLKLRLTYNALTSEEFVFEAVEAHPGVFTTDSSGCGQSAALNYHENTGAFSLNSASSSAPRGSTVVLYATGGGALDPAPAIEGQVVPLAPPLPYLTGQVSVTIGGEGATVQSATAVPGSLAGLVQLNLTVPATVKPGKDLPVVVTIAGRSSPATATLSVR